MFVINDGENESDSEATSALLLLGKLILVINDTFWARVKEWDLTLLRNGI